MKKTIFLLLLFLQPLCADFPTTPEQKTALEKICEAFSADSRSLWVQQGKERWEFDERYQDKRDLLLPLFEEAGFLKERPPLKKSYDALLIHGATLGRLQERWLFALYLYEQGVRFSSIVFLSGERSLQEWEKQAIQDPTITSEAALTRWLYEGASLPEGMEKIPVLFINAPAVPPHTRATTKDTVLSWLQKEPWERDCLAISNQPYILYQQAVLENHLPSDFQLETVGPGCHTEPSIALLLDTLGRILRL